MRRKAKAVFVNEPRLTCEQGRRALLISISSADGNAPYVSLAMREPNGWESGRSTIRMESLRAVAKELLAIAKLYDKDPFRPPQVAVECAPKPELVAKGTKRPPSEDIPW